MPSVQDIPEPLLARERAGDFVAWLIEIPLDKPTRIALARIWERHADHKLTTPQFSIIVHKAGE